MFLSFLLLTCCLQIFKASSQEISVVRHLDGDIFTVEGSCSTACSDLSSFTATPYRRQSTITNGAVGLSSSSSANSTCICQCNPTQPLFREDLHICVSDLHECSVTGFLSSSGVVEKIPYIFLPQQGQIIYPQAEIEFHGVITPVCGIAGAQQLGKSGWSELRNLSSTESPFRLFKDEGRTFLQWIGEGGLREAAEGKVVIVRLVCRDASPKSSNRSVFTPCVAFRVAGSPSKNSIREVTFVSTVQSQQGLSTIEYTAIGISALLLALIYIASVLLYLHSRRVRRKMMKNTEVIISNCGDGPGIVKNNPLLAASRHFETDSNSVPSESDRGEEYDQSGSEPSRFEKITSAIVHPHVMYIEQCENSFGSSIIAERLPEENVRIVETIENAYQQDIPVLPGTQRRKLYFNPAYFDRQLLLAPPPAAIEFLFKIREVISIAKHKLMAKRFIPTLTGIPEEETTSERCSSSNKRTGSIQSSVAKSKKSQRCTGCPGCLESRQNNLPMSLPDNSRPTPGESRVRAWLEDIKPPERRWRDPEDSQKNFQENVRTFARSLEHLNDIGGDFLRSNHSSVSGGKALASWKDNPPMLRTFQNIARSEILGDDDRHSISRKSTKSMFEDTNYDRFCRTRRCNLEMTSVGLDDTINAKVRKAIENSFIKQMEENAALEFQIIDNDRNQNEQRFSPDGSSEKTNLESINSAKKSPESIQKRRKNHAPGSLTKELPDMINELPTSKLQAKRIMDAVIKEMVDVKALEHHVKISDVDYEIDSLERTNRRLDKKTNNTPEKLSKESETTNSGKNNTDSVKLNDSVTRKNYYNNLPELITQKSEGYSLVSEVYVNDGYASPANSDDSGPEICYKAEKPGHLTIKVQDSPENYIKQDESEYEPDTLDRKPMKLKINGDVFYEKPTSNEIYVDSLERPAHILLKSKGSFRDDATLINHNNSILNRGYGSLREIYEAKLRSNMDSNLLDNTESLTEYTSDNCSWKNSKYLTPDTRHVRRQRKLSQPDVVPMPPSENIYQQPKQPRKIEESKNEQDRRIAEAGNPTASGRTPVHNKKHVGTTKKYSDPLKNIVKKPNPSGKVEDSGYLSSTDSSESNKQLLKYEFGSVSETDDTESICDGASESGAESVGTDSVFFGNFRRLSNLSQYSKSMDSGVDIGMKNSCSISTKLERHTGVNSSDSENESFITVLPYSTKCKNNNSIF
ncbi:hypothetical protein PV327_006028 [Microctonus hyperodae]|uniref:Shavenoid isoform B-like N-terminal domain-containing protein n=1 Tax=Microctonus hyperodae TaxID=165561 RepID=A0AA39L0B8_MICHY|nr:hypothetical protein PV327_006028 [Microctonus hyperodae]